MTTPVAPTPKEPSMRLALCLAFGLGLVSLALSTYALLTNTGKFTMDEGWFFGLMLNVLSAPILAVAGAVLAGRDLKQSAPLQPIPVYVLRALHRCRYLLVVDIALMPVVVLGWMYESIYYAAMELYFRISPCSTNSAYPGCADATRPLATLHGDVVAQTLNMLQVILGIWGLCLLLPTLGAVVARVCRSARLGVAVAWTGGFALGYVGTLPVFSAMPPTATQISLLALPYLLTALILLLAQPIAKAWGNANSRQTL